MDLNALRAFLVIAEEQHVTRAAERLQVAQPNLTRTMRKLEKELGFELFVHSNKRHLEMTAAGEAFFVRIMSMLEQYEEAVQVAHQIARREHDQLVVGYTAIMMFRLLPLILRAYQHFPEVTLALRDVSTHSQRAQLAALSRGKVDVALIPQPPPEQGLEQECISRGNWLVAFPVSHPMAQEGRISLSSLSDAEWISWPRSNAPLIYDTQMAFFRQAGFEPRIVERAQQSHSIVNLVANGRGIALVSPWTPQGITHPQVMYRPLLEDMPVELYVVWRKDERSPLVQTFLQVVREVREKQGGVP